MPNFAKYFSNIISNLVNTPSGGSHDNTSTLSSSTSDTEALLNPPSSVHAQNTLPRSKKSISRACKSLFPQSSKQPDKPSSPTSYYTSGPTRLRWDTENSIPPGPNPFKTRFDMEYHLNNAPLLRAGHAPETPQRESRARLEQDSVSTQQHSLDGSWTSYLPHSTPPSTAESSVASAIGETSTPPLSTSPQHTPSSKLPTPSPEKHVGLGISGLSPAQSPGNASRSFDGLGRVGMKTSARRYTIPTRQREVPSTWRHCIIGGFDDVQEHESDFAALHEDDGADTDDEVTSDIFSASFSPPPPVRRHFLRGYEGDLYDPMGSLAYDYNSPPEISQEFYEEMVNTWTLDEGSFMAHVLHSIPEEDVEGEFDEVDLGSKINLLGDMSSDDRSQDDESPESPPSTPMKSRDSTSTSTSSPQFAESTLPTPPTTPEGIIKPSLTLIEVEIDLEDFKVDLETTS